MEILHRVLSFIRSQGDDNTESDSEDWSVTEDRSLIIILAEEVNWKNNGGARGGGGGFVLLSLALFN